MIHVVEPADRDAYGDALRQYFELRKKVFCDRLGWVADDGSGIETDRLDRSHNVYVLYIDEDDEKVLGGVRLMPTTGPTLVHSVWPHLLPDPEEFRSPSIWEATRFCVDESAETRKGNFANPTTIALAAAAFEFSAANGITHLIGVCERNFLEMAAAFSAEAEILATARDANGCEIGCGLWPTHADARFRSWARPLMRNLDAVTEKRREAVTPQEAAPMERARPS